MKRFIFDYSKKLFSLNIKANFHYNVFWNQHQKLTVCSKNWVTDENLIKVKIANRQIDGNPQTISKVHFL